MYAIHSGHSGSGAPWAEGAQTFTQNPNSSSGCKTCKHCWDNCQVPEPENYRQAFSEWVDRAAKYLSTCLRHKDYNINPNIVPNQNGLRELAHLAAKAHKENLDFLELYCFFYDIQLSKYEEECFFLF